MSINKQDLETINQDLFMAIDPSEEAWIAGGAAGKSTVSGSVTYNNGADGGADYDYSW